MRRIDWTIVGYMAAIALVLFYVGYTVWLLATCDGHVLRNAFDWPVCIASGK